MSGRYSVELYKLKAELCKTFSDAKRLMIISELREGEKSVGQLSENINAPQAVVSRHLAILRQRGVVETRRDGVSIYYRLTDFKILAACDIVHEVLMTQVSRNKELAEKLNI